jgi:hypothetical protein
MDISESPKDSQLFFPGRMVLRGLIAFSLVLICLGAALMAYAATLPLYTDPTAPDRISLKLESISSESLRYNEWETLLHVYETSHKRISDWGRGLGAAGLGIALAIGIGFVYRRITGVAAWVMVLACWVGLWLARIPFTIWYYDVRYDRFDYPIWSDAIAIPIYQESVVWILGAIISTLLLGALVFGRFPQPGIRIFVPSTLSGWLRTVFLVAWLDVLGVMIGGGISDGDEGAIICGLGASSILLIILAAQNNRR